MTNIDPVELMKQTEISKPWEQEILQRPLEHYQKTSGLLLHAFDETGDPRFLNTALKLHDMLSVRIKYRTKKLKRREEDGIKKLRRGRGV